MFSPVVLSQNNLCKGEPGFRPLSVRFPIDYEEGTGLHSQNLLYRIIKVIHHPQNIGRTVKGIDILHETYFSHKIVPIRPLLRPYTVRIT